MAADEREPLQLWLGGCMGGGWLSSAVASVSESVLPRPRPFVNFVRPSVGLFACFLLCACLPVRLT